MSVVARAPGKLVVLGEYAVLTGAHALVMAVDRYAVAAIDESAAAECALTTHTDGTTTTTFAPGARSGVALVDLVHAHWPALASGAWAGSLDSRQLFAEGGKLGLGSSAAALCAWSGAWRAFNGSQPPDAVDLIALHTARQGAGSGLDVAASRAGGVICYRRDRSAGPTIGSGRLPDGVAFVAISTGRAASTPDLVRRFDAWRAAEPRAALLRLDRLAAIAETGVAAAQANAASDFLAAIEHYSVALGELGQAMQADIMTDEHRAIAAVASRSGVAYKVSGAGGGDIGLALSASLPDLAAFKAALPRGCEALTLELDRGGLQVLGNPTTGDGK
jgi:phosphomevalonate kinase